MHCPVCGFDNNEGVNTCKRCGTKFSFLVTDQDTLKRPADLVKGHHKGEQED